MKTTLAALIVAGAALTPAAFAGTDFPITVQYDASTETTSTVKEQVEDACKDAGHGLRGLDASRMVRVCVDNNLEQVKQAIADSQTIVLASAE